MIDLLPAFLIMPAEILNLVVMIRVKRIVVGPAEPAAVLAHDVVQFPRQVSLGMIERGLMTGRIVVPRRCTGTVGISPQEDHFLTFLARVGKRHFDLAAVVDAQVRYPVQARFRTPEQVGKGHHDVFPVHAQDERLLVGIIAGGYRAQSFGDRTRRHAERRIVRRQGRRILFGGVIRIGSRSDETLKGKNDT